MSLIMGEREQGLIERYSKRFGLCVQEVSSVPESYSSQVFALSLRGGGKIILKIPYNIKKFKRELNILKMLESDFPVPKVLDYWEGAEDIPAALLLSFIDGEPLTGKIDKDLAWQMGYLLGSLHTISLPEYGLVPEEKTDWKRSLEITAFGWLQELKTLLALTEIIKMEQAFKTFLDRLPPPRGPVLIHMDYRPGNILVQNAKIKGLIDFESSRGGEAEIDCSKMKVEVWEQYQGTKKAFVEGYENTGSKLSLSESEAFYDYFLALGAVAWSLRRAQTNAPFFYTNLEKIRNWKQWLY